MLDAVVYFYQFFLFLREDFILHSIPQTKKNNINRQIIKIMKGALCEFLNTYEKAQWIVLPTLN